LKLKKITTECFFALNEGKMMRLFGLKKFSERDEKYSLRVFHLRIAFGAKILRSFYFLLSKCNLQTKNAR